MADSTIARVDIDTTRIMAGSDCRARIEALLDKAASEVLADLWQQVFPYPADELPDRQGIIEDLADFAEVLQPQLAGMRADQLCWLIEKYAGRRSRSRSFVRSLICGVGDTAVLHRAACPASGRRDLPRGP
jgi:hypothetical protein